jgi:hypothetical protein
VSPALYVTLGLGSQDAGTRLMIEKKMNLGGKVNLLSAPGGMHIESKISLLKNSRMKTKNQNFPLGCFPNFSLVGLLMSIFVRVALRHRYAYAVSIINLKHCIFLVILF